MSDAATTVLEADSEEVLTGMAGEPPVADGGPRFTIELTQDQKDIRDWVHGFAEGVVRPAAHEWDEREETPWSVIQEAAKIGLYSFEAMGQFWADDTGLTLPIANEELFWGDAGIGMAIMGTSLAVAAIFARLLVSLLFGVSAIDPWTFIGVTFVLLAVALLACYIPARRALTVDPLIALRYD